MRSNIKSLRNKSQSGFTLVEMAIVLVIVGLLIGGVLKGQELINSAKVKNLANDFRNMPTLIYSYQDKFRALPGDDAQASTHLTGGVVGSSSGATAGNGKLEGAWNSTTATDESYLFWQHVRLAGLATGVTDTTATSAAYLSKNSSGGAIGIESGSNHYIKDATGSGYLSGSYVLCSQGIDGKSAKQLDTALDDGDSQTGLLRIVASDHTAGTAGKALSAVADGDSYTVCQGI